ncbi:MAG: hypothetical protein ABIL68_09690 [bacterium]
MTKKVKIPEKYQGWIDARKRYHLSHAHIQMARELGMNPKKFGKIANHKQEPWKAPLPVFIEGLYFKRFGKSRPDEVKSMEQMVKIEEKKKAEHRERKQRKKQGIITMDNNVIKG